MANLSDEFEIFLERITPPACAQTALELARNAIRERIRTYFRQTLNARVPKFWSQGAFAVDTTVNPIEGEHHIEDGVYLQNLDKQNMANWPSGDVVHGWIADAVQGRAVPSQAGSPEIVRIRSAKQYCLDLHCYADLYGSYFRAIKGSAAWSGLRPLAATGWFRSYVHQRGDQLRRIVRYLIAWAEYQSKSRGLMPDRLILTVLATYNFQRDNRDDQSFARTLMSIANYVHSIVYILNPVNIREELSARLTEAQKASFQEAVEDAANMANAALIIDNAHRASKLWRRQLGNRFPQVQEL